MRGLSSAAARARHSPFSGARGGDDSDARERDARSAAVQATEGSLRQNPVTARNHANEFSPCGRVGSLGARPNPLLNHLGPGRLPQSRPTVAVVLSSAVVR